MAEVDIDAHYKSAKAILWVEDPGTRAWLDSVWQGAAPTIRVLVAGGHVNVKTVCEQAVDLGHRHIFGLVDCDFGRTNWSHWSTLAPKERVYRLDVHEYENLLLDPEALVSCKLNTGKRTLVDVDARLTTAAASRAWWVACLRFLTETNKAAMVGYPKHPATIASLADAEKYVRGSVWFTTTAGQCSTLATSTTVTAGLNAAYVNAAAAVADGSWRQSFPGKELFNEIGAYVQPGAIGSAGRNDLIKAVGEWQRLNKMPMQAAQLRACILARI